MSELTPRRAPRARLAALALCAAAPAAHAFIVIDTAGPRELITAADEGEAFRDFSVKLSTKDKTLSGLYLFHMGKLDGPPSTQAGELPGWNIFTGGATLKFKATKGVEEFLKFDKTPATEGGLLLNWTRTPAGDTGPIQSATAQAGFTYESVDHVPLTGNPLSEIRSADNRGAYASLSYGVYLRGLTWLPDALKKQLSLVISAEARRQTNAADLPLASVGKLTTLPDNAAGDTSRAALIDSKSVRWGDLKRGNVYPLTAAVVFTQAAQWPVGLLGEKEGVTGLLYWAPYYRYTPSSDLGDARAAGLALTVRLRTEDKEKDETKKKPATLSYPLSLFYEWGTKPGKSEWQGKAGAGVTFSWGK